MRNAVWWFGELRVRSQFIIINPAEEYMGNYFGI